MQTARCSLAMGETPSLAARLQGLAEPNGLIVGDSTHRLAGGLFTCTSLGPQRLKGFDAPVCAWQVMGERAVESRFEARQHAQPAPMVARDRELALLVERWQQASRGEGQMVLLTGEPGIGKSRLTRALVDSVAADEPVRIHYQCSPFYTDRPLYPAVQDLTLAAGFKSEDALDAKLGKLEKVFANVAEEPGAACALMAALLGLDAETRYGPINLSAQQQRTQTLRALATRILGLARRQSVLFVIEDAHWIDPSTLELIQLCLDAAIGARVLIVVTARPGFTHRFSGHAIVTRLTLSRLGRAPVAAIIGQLTGGKALPGEVLDEITAKTDGVPLFVEELTKTVLESQVLVEEGERYRLSGSLPSVTIPSTLHDSLMVRLDRLTSVAKETAQLGAVLGRQFSYELAAAVSQLAPDSLQQALDVLTSAELIHARGIPPETTYSFKHALVQEAAYNSLVRSKREALHARVSHVLEERFAHTVASEPELLAHHYGEAGQPEPALRYGLKAGESSIERFANVEVIERATQSIALLDSLSESALRDRHELRLQLALGTTLRATDGYQSPQAAQRFDRAMDLAQQMGDRERFVQAARGRASGHLIQGQLHQSRAIGEAVVANAVDSSHLMEGKAIVGEATVYQGDLSTARQSLEESCEGSGGC